MSKQPEQQVVTKKTMDDFFAQANVKDRIMQALGEKANLTEFLSNVTIEILKNDDLKKCTFESILQCAIDSANFGLIPNKQLGHAYLIPYQNWKQKTWECQLQFGYKGYIKKMSDAGISVEVELVTKEELEQGRFEEMRGSQTYIVHRPIRSGIRNGENIVLGYAIARKAGSSDRMAVMSLDEIYAVAESEVYDKTAQKKVRSLKGVWSKQDRETDLGEMCKKTLIRRLVKICEIDVVQLMAAREYEAIKNIKDVTPMANEGMTNAISNMTSDIRSIENQNSLNTLLAQAQQQIPVVKQSLTTDPIPQPVGNTDILKSEIVAAPSHEALSLGAAISPQDENHPHEEPSLPLKDSIFPGDINVN